MTTTAAAPGSALVTGGGRRIGRALALELARLGWNVAVHYHQAAEAAGEVVAAIEATDRRAIALAADLADEDARAALVDRAAGALGPINLLINNAAIFEFDRPATATATSWNRHLGINLRAPLVLSQGLMAQLPDDVTGVIVNLIDQRVLSLTPNYTSYTISKLGLWGLTQHLALALAPRARVNAIAPGLTLRAEGMDEPAFRELFEAAPLGQGTTLDDLGRALGFILSTPSMTGQMITLDGGLHLGRTRVTEPPDHGRGT